MNDIEYRSLLGAYALGILDTGERRVVDDHLAECLDCRRELALLTEAERALAEVPPEMVTGVGTGGVGSGLSDMDVADLTDLDFDQLEAEGAALDNDLILQRTVRQVRAERGQGRRFRVAGVAAGVAVLLTAGVASGIAVGHRTAERPSEALPTPSASATVPGTEEATGRDPSTGTTMTATVVPAAGWARLNAKVMGVKKGEHCRLVAVTASGQREIGGSWVVGEKGAGPSGTQIAGSVAIPAKDIKSLDVVTFDGRRLVSVSMA